MTDKNVLKSHYADIGGAKIHYHDEGRGEVLILLHGGGAGASGYSNFSRNIGPLSQHFRVIVPDQPGYGRSDHLANYDDGVFGARAMAILRFMDALELDKASFVGNSLGGGTTFRLALKAPERANKLILMGPGGSPPLFSPWPSEGLRRILNFYGGEGPTLEKMRAILEELVYDPASVTPELLQERFDAAVKAEAVKQPPLTKIGETAADEIWRQPLGTLTHDTLLVYGREDRMVPLDSAFLPLRMMPNAHLYVFPKCGHWAQWEWAEEFNALLLQFMKRPPLAAGAHDPMRGLRGTYDARQGR